MKHLKSDFKIIINLGGKQRTPLNLERRKLGTFVLILPLQSAIDQEPQVGLEKAMPFAFCMGDGNSTYHLVYYLSVDKKGRADFLAKNARKEMCVSPFKRWNFEKCGFE